MTSLSKHLNLGITLLTISSVTLTGFYRLREISDLPITLSLYAVDQLSMILLSLRGLITCFMLIVRINFKFKPLLLQTINLILLALVFVFTASS